VRYAVIEPAAAYRVAITTGTLPNARRVVDEFHVATLTQNRFSAVAAR